MMFLLVFALVMGQAFGASPQSDDSLMMSREQDSVDFLNNLAGLGDLWWVQTAASNQYLKRPPSDRDTTYIPSFSDEEYYNRISRINSVVKLSYNSKVRAYIDLYCQKRRDLVEFMLGFSEYYFPMFEQVLDQEKVPQELKYLALIESALNPRATSKAGAVGLWQFMYSTGRMYGLKANSYVDERRDPIKATHSAARFLKDLNVMFDDWVLALAAYNCGPGNVKKAIRRAGGRTDYWEIYPYLPVETRGYVPAYIAATYVMHYHESHNLYPRKINIPTTLDTIMVTEKLHLQQVADVMQVPIQLLEDMNPQYRLNIIPYDDKANPLYLPGELGERFVELSDSIYAFKDSVYFDPEYLNKQPARYAYNGKRVASQPVNKGYHTVRSGESLGRISAKYGCSVQQLKDWNNLRGNVIMAGQKLVVNKPKQATPKESESKSAATSSKSSSSVSVSGGNKSNIAGGNGNTIIYYKVKPGDTLWAITQKYPGVSENDIIKLNGLKNGNAIFAGMKLKIKLKI